MVAGMAGPAPRKKAAARPVTKKAAATKSATPRTKKPPAKTTAKRAAKAPKVTDAQRVRVVQWATTHGAPVRMLEGWNPETGEWSQDSPIGRMLTDIDNGIHVYTAARHNAIPHMSQLMTRCSDFAETAVEERAFIPIEALPFVDLHREIEHREADIESVLVKVIVDKARTDPHQAMLFLSRRFPSRWREQQQVLTVEDADARDAAVSSLLSDPNVAMQLARIAESVEQQVAADEAE
jgi:hypothetical protein